MAYPQFYPQYYPQTNFQNQMPSSGFQQPSQQALMNYQQPPQQTGSTYQNPQPQIQNGGFISVRSEEEARNFPVAPGTSVTFIDENKQRVYAKTMGFSQLDRPIFDRYKLVKEAEAVDLSKPLSDQNLEGTGLDPRYVLKEDFETLRKEYDGLLKDIRDLREKLEDSEDAENTENTAKKTASKTKKEGEE